MTETARFRVQKGCDYLSIPPPATNIDTDCVCEREKERERERERKRVMFVGHPFLSRTLARTVFVRVCGCLLCVCVFVCVCGCVWKCVFVHICSVYACTHVHKICVETHDLDKHVTLT